MSISSSLAVPFSILLFTITRFLWHLPSFHLAYLLPCIIADRQFPEHPAHHNRPILYQYVTTGMALRRTLLTLTNARIMGSVNHGFANLVHPTPHISLLLICNACENGAYRLEMALRCTLSSPRARRLMGCKTSVARLSRNSQALATVNVYLSFARSSRKIKLWAS